MKGCYISSCVKRKIKHWLLNIPIRTILIVVLLMFILIFLLLFCLNRIDCSLEGTFPDAFFRLNDDSISTWFSFYGSYIGAIATVVLGLITLRLSIKISEMDNVSAVNTFSAKKVCFYDFWRDFKPSVMKESRCLTRYCLRLKFKKYRPYYKMTLMGMEWGRSNTCLDGEQKEMDLYSINIKDHRFVEKDNTFLYIFFDDPKCADDEDTFNYFYRIHAYEPLTMKPDERERTIILQIDVENRLFKSEHYDVTLELLVENKKYENGCARLQIVGSKATVKLDNGGQDERRNKRKVS